MPKLAERANFLMLSVPILRKFHKYESRWSDVKKSINDSAKTYVAKQSAFLAIQKIENFPLKKTINPKSIITNERCYCLKDPRNDSRFLIPHILWIDLNTNSKHQTIYFFKSLQSRLTFRAKTSPISWLTTAVKSVSSFCTLSAISAWVWITVTQALKISLFYVICFCEHLLQRATKYH